MIRIVLRHELEADGVLLGDFPPSEVRPLLDLLSDSDIYVDGELPTLSGVTQFVKVGGKVSSRYIYEILLDGPVE